MIKQGGPTPWSPATQTDDHFCRVAQFMRELLPLSGKEGLETVGGAAASAEASGALSIAVIELRVRVQPSTVVHVGGYCVQ